MGWWPDSAPTGLSLLNFLLLFSSATRRFVLDMRMSKHRYAPRTLKLLRERMQHIQGLEQQRLSVRLLLRGIRSRLSSGVCDHRMGTLVIQLCSTSVLPFCGGPQRDERRMPSKPNHPVSHRRSSSEESRHGDLVSSVCRMKA